MMSLDGICREVAERTDIGPLEKLATMIHEMSAENRRRFECDTKLDELVNHVHDKHYATVKSLMLGFVTHIASVLEEGVRTGEIATDDPGETALDILYAGKGVVDPASIMRMSEDEFERRIKGITRLIIEGVRAR
jgi:hypothetical protein